MGANQAMRDCAEMLPELVSLDRIAKSGSSPSTAQISAACKRYEDSMIDRAFTWVKKSGGTSIEVSNIRDASQLSFERSENHPKLTYASVV